jgi:hypothetical protein
MRSYLGTAQPTRLAELMAVDATSITVEDDDGWPDGSDNRTWMAVIDRGRPNEQVVEFNASAANVWTVESLTADGSTVFEHDPGAKVEPWLDAEGYQAMTLRDYKRGQFGQNRDTDGDTVLNNTAWTHITGMDLAILADDGDWLEVGLDFLLESAAVDVYLDVVTILAGATVQYASGQAGGAAEVGMLLAPTGVRARARGSAIFQLAASDVPASPVGTVTLRPVFRSSGATNRTLNRTANVPAIVWAKNLGPLVT